MTPPGVPSSTIDTKKIPDSEPTPWYPDLPDVVGIGASAGDLEAIEEFIDNLGDDIDAAFVIVQHLSPDFSSRMGELLARHTDKKINRIEDGMLVERDAIYLIPPRVNLELCDGRLHLTDQAPGDIPKPIDIFFGSLALERGERAVGVILSGTGGDGSRGAQEIRQRGGLIAVHDPELATSDGMPRAAMDPGAADTVCAPRDMPARIHSFLAGVDRSLDWERNAEESGGSAVREILNLLQEARVSRGRQPIDPTPKNDRIIAALLDQFTPACVVVSGDFEVQHLFGDSSGFLSLPVGRVKHDIFRLVAPDLRATLSSCLHRARKAEGAISADGFNDADGVLRNQVLVRWVADSTSESNGFFLICARRPAPETAAAAHITAIESSQGCVDQLKSERQHTKESPQSTNEELYSVNTEHLSKIQELTVLSGETENLLRSIEIGVILLDAELNIRRFTPRVREVIAILDSDIGRPIDHLAQSLRGTNISKLAEEVLANNARVERESTDAGGHPWMVGGRPYLSGSGSKGVVLTFVDIAPIKAAEESLARSELRLGNLVEQLDQVLWILEPQTGEFIYASPRFERLWGCTARELYQDQGAWLKPIHSEDQELVKEVLAAAGTEDGVDLEFRLLVEDRTRWIHMRGFPIRDPNDRISGIAGLASDVTAAKESNLRLAANESLLRSLIEGLPDVFWLTDAEGERFLYCSPAFESVFGYQGAALLESSELWFEVIDPMDREIVRESWSRLTSIGIDAEYRITKGDALRWVHTRGYPVRDSDGQVIGVCGVVADITEQKYRAEQLRSMALDMENQAQTDMLTGLLNRRGIEMALARERLRSARNGQHTATILLDLDEFKDINGRYGHRAGDEVLGQVGKQVRKTLRPSDLAGRVGGDEFLVVLPETRLAEGVRIAERVRIAIADAVTQADEDLVQVTASLGLAMVPSDMISIEEILTATREALATCKSEGKNRVIVTTDQEGKHCVFSPVAGSIAEQLEELTITAVAQPIIRLTDDAVVGYEMFSRGPEGPLADPSNIFRLSQEQMVLTRTDLHCLKRCSQASKTLPDQARIHINLFPTTLTEATAKEILAVFASTGGSERFCIELSEQQFLGAPDYLQKAVHELRKAGVKIALDDVGFGRSSLESLILLEPDVAKISQTLVKNIDTLPEKRRNLQRLVRVLRELCPVVSAKGVETAGEARCLRQSGLTEGQGYYFEHPQPCGILN